MILSRLRQAARVLFRWPLEVLIFLIECGGDCEEVDL